MSNLNIVIIDYDIGNVKSISNAFLKIGANVKLSRHEDDILEADGVVLPGVGAFAHAMNNLKKFDLPRKIKKFVQTGKPLLGICLGMQILFTESEEFGLSEGLNLISGRVIKFPFQQDLKVKLPNVGWSELYKPEDRKWENTILDKLKEEEDVYFVHSVICIPEDDKNILSYSEYSNYRFCSSVEMNNISGCQFHPEKSSKTGIVILENFLKKAERI